MEVMVYKTYLREDRTPYLVAEKSGYHVDGRSRHTSCEKVYELAKQMEMDRWATEHVYLLLFDQAMHLIGMHEVSHGSVNVTAVCNREICQAALLAGAVQCILIHNHPSGCCKPSRQDYKVTSAMKESLSYVGITLLDHIVIGSEGYHSIEEEKE